MEKPEFKYATKDIDEGAFLACQEGVRYSGAESRGRSVFFLFEPGAGAADLSGVFYSKRGAVEPKSFSQWQRDLRDIVRKSREGGVKV